MAQRSLVIEALTASFLRSLGVGDVEPRARWLVRVIISLLTFPGRDPAEEREMLDRFVLPVVLPESRPRSARSVPSSPGAAATPAAR
jgi:hypothetical protein